MKDGVQVLGIAKTGLAGDFFQRDVPGGQKSLGRAELDSQNLGMDATAQDSLETIAERGPRNVNLPGHVHDLDPLTGMLANVEQGGRHDGILRGNKIGRLSSHHGYGIDEHADADADGDSDGADFLVWSQHRIYEQAPWPAFPRNKQPFGAMDAWLEDTEEPQATGLVNPIETPRFHETQRVLPGWHY